MRRFLTKLAITVAALFVLAYGLDWLITKNLRHSDARMFHTYNAILNDSLERYHVMRAAELPNVKVEFLEDGTADGPFGAKSIGEAALVPVMPAVLAALNDALGSSFSSVPVTPEKVLAYLEKEAGR